MHRAPPQRLTVPPSFRPNRRPRHRLGQCLELEARLAPTVFTVTNLADGGLGSLRAALASADADASAQGGVVQFAPALAGQTINLTSVGDGQFGPSALRVTATGGPGSGRVTIDGGTGGVTVARSGAAGTPNFRLFAVQSGANLMLANLTLRGGVALGGAGAAGGGGAAGLGGGVYNAGSLTVTGCTLTDNQAVGGGILSVGGWGGGGLGGDGGPSIGGDAGQGGGPAGGSAGVGPRGLGGSGGFGGGGGHGMGGNGGFGGGGGAGGGNGGFGGGGAELGRGGFGGGANGTGTAAGGGAGLGGAVFNQGGSLILTNSTFTANLALGGNGAGAGGGASGLGGAVFNLDGRVTAAFCTFAANTVAAGSNTGGTAGGGAVYNLALNLADSQGPPSPLPNTTAALTLSECILTSSVGGTDLANDQQPGATVSSNASAPNLVGGNARLGPLQNNGGPTPTMGLLPGSPALNAGGPSSGSPADQRGLARTGQPLLDLGAFAAVPNGFRLFAVGTGPGTWGLASAYNGDGSLRFTLSPYPGFSGGVQVAVGDVRGTGHDDLVTVPGAGGSPEVHVYDGLSGALVSSFNAYDPRFTGGVQIALGDTAGQGFANLITVPQRGGSPEVRAFTAAGTLLYAYNAYDPAFTGGLQVAAADTSGGGYANVITAPDAGGSPEVRVFDGPNPVIAAPGVGVPTLGDFNAYDVRFTGGLSLAVADTRGLGYASIVTAPGAGGTPEVHVYAGLTLAQAYNAYDMRFTGGISLAAADVFGRGYADVVTALGAGPSSEVRVFDGKNPTVGPSGNATPDSAFGAYPPGPTVGIVLIARDVAAQGYADIVTTTGPGAAADVRLFDLLRGALLADFVPFGPTFTGGVSLA